MDKLAALPALHGVDDVAVGETRLAADPDLGVLALSPAEGAQDAFGALLAAAFGAAPPPPGRSTGGPSPAPRLIWVAPDQLWLLSAPPTSEANAVARLGETGYATDQTDGWTALRLSGPAARAALERLCRVDVSADAFAVGACARAAFEKIAVCLLREEMDAYLILTPRSSAADLHHALVVALRAAGEAS